MGNEKQYIVEELTIQWPKEKGKNQTGIYKTLHRKLNVEQHNPTQTGGELRCSRRVNRSFYISCTGRVTAIY